MRLLQLAENDSFRDRVERWIKGIDSEIELSGNYADDMREFIEFSLKEAEGLLDSAPSYAYGKVLKLANVSSHAARRKPALVELLGHYVERFIGIMQKVKKALGAVSFSITVSFPFDLYISLSF